MTRSLWDVSFKAPVTALTSQLDAKQKIDDPRGKGGIEKPYGPTQSRKIVVHI